MIQGREMSYAILRTAKLKTIGNICGSLSHNYRTRETHNADAQKLDLNEHDLKTDQEVRQAIENRLPEKRRKDAVLCIEHLITASPDWDGWKDQAKEEKFFKKSLDWLKKTYGSENVISTSIHRDETTPHMVAYVVPLDEQTKRLNAKKWLGGRDKLSRMQTDFAEEVRFMGLERGLRGSKAEHTTIQKYYSKVNTPIPQTPKIIAPKTKLLESNTKYGERVISSTLEQIQPIWEIVATHSNELKSAQKTALEARQSLKALENKVRPYLDALEGLTSEEKRKLEVKLELGVRDIKKQRALKEKELQENKQKELEMRKALAEAARAKKDGKRSRR